jgi:hypothetical protein
LQLTRGFHRRLELVLFLIVTFDAAKKEGFADSETRDRLRLRVAVRDLSTAFALLTSLKMTAEERTIQKIFTGAELGKRASAN